MNFEVKKSRKNMNLNFKTKNLETLKFKIHFQKNSIVFKYQ